MEILEIAPNARATWADALTALWEASVRASHFFLPEGEVETMAPMVGYVLEEIAVLLVAVEKDVPWGFLGIQENKAEMLFIHPSAFKQGLGKALLLHAIKSYHVCFVDVNEQNPNALGFYEHLGFKVFARSPLDSEGKPYPLLHMRLPDSV